MRRTGPLRGDLTCALWPQHFRATTLVSTRSTRTTSYYARARKRRMPLPCGRHFSWSPCARARVRGPRPAPSLHSPARFPFSCSPVPADFFPFRCQLFLEMSRLRHFVFALHPFGGPLVYNSASKVAEWNLDYFFSVFASRNAISTNQG